MRTQDQVRADMADCLLLARLKNDLNYEEMASRLEISVSHYRAVEAGVADLPTLPWMRACLEFSIPLDADTQKMKVEGRLI